MKKILLSTLVITGFSFGQTYARIKIPVGSVEKIEKVADLPDTDSFKTRDGKFIDIGSKYTIFEIAWIPIYTQKSPELVGYSGEENNFYEFTPEELNVILSEQKLDKKALEKMSFWNAYGGKLVLGAILALIAWGYFPSKKKKEEVIPQNL